VIKVFILAFEVVIEVESAVNKESSRELYFKICNSERSHNNIGDEHDWHNDSASSGQQSARKVLNQDLLGDGGVLLVPLNGLAHLPAPSSQHLSLRPRQEPAPAAQKTLM